MPVLLLELQKVNNLQIFSMVLMQGNSFNDSEFHSNVSLTQLQSSLRNWDSLLKITHITLHVNQKVGVVLVVFGALYVYISLLAWRIAALVELHSFELGDLTTHIGIF